MNDSLPASSSKIENNNTASAPKRNSLANYIPTRSQNPNLGEQQLHQFEGKSLFLFSKDSKIRIICARIVFSSYGQNFFLIVSAISGLALGFSDYSWHMDSSKQYEVDSFFLVLNYIFAVIFMVEFLLKIVTMGFVLEKNAYLRLKANVFEFIMMLVSVSLATWAKYSTIIRIFNTFRTFRLISLNTQLRMLSHSVVKSLPALGKVCFSSSVLMILVANFAIQFLGGADESRCRLTPEPLHGSWPAVSLTDNTCGVLECSIGYCGNPSLVIPPLDRNQTEFDNVYWSWGIINYNSFPNATLNVFTAFTGEGWSLQMYQFWHTKQQIVVLIFFTGIIVFGYFFLMNLILAIIYYEFEQLSGAGGSLKKLRQQRHERRETTRKHAGSVVRRTRKSARRSKFLKPEAIPEASLKAEGGHDDTSPRTRTRRSLPKKENSSEKSVESTIELKAISAGEDQASQKIENNQNGPYEEEEDDSEGSDSENENENDTSPGPGADQGEVKRRDLWASYRACCAAIVKTTGFNIYVMTTIFINAIALSLYKHPIDTKFEMTLKLINTVMNLLFLIEIIIKVSATGFKAYFTSVYSIFDALVIIGGVVFRFLMIFVTAPELIDVVKTFNTLTIMRVFQLSNIWKPLNIFAITIKKTLTKLWIFLLLLVIVITVCGLIGMELYAYRVRFINNGNTVALDLVSGTSPRNNFDNIWNAGLSMLELFSKDSWGYNVMYPHMRATNPIGAGLFFSTMLIIGFVILLRLFLAMVISEFMKSFEETEREEMEKMAALTGSVVDQPGAQPPLQTQVQSQPAQSTSEWTANVPVAGARPTITSLRLTKKQQNQDKLQRICVGTSLKLFSSQNKFRLACGRLVSHPWFVTFRNVMILSTLLLLVLDHPFLPPGTWEHYFIMIANDVIQVCFLVEIAIKIIVRGFYWNGPFSYCKNAWRLADGVLVVLGSSIFLRHWYEHRFLSFILILRVPRIINLTIKSRITKAALMSLVKATPNLLKLGLFCTILTFVFAIFGIQYKGGALYRCETSNVPANVEIVTKQDCMDYGGDWINNDFNFDDITRALELLFQMSTAVNWENKMFDLIDSRGVDLHPVQDSNPWWTIFYVVTLIFGNYFVWNLFSAVIVDAFFKELSANDRLDGLNKQQTEWIRLNQTMARLRPIYYIPTPRDPARKVWYDRFNSKTYNRIQLIILTVGALSCTLSYLRQPGWLEIMLLGFQYLVQISFTVDIMIKLYTLEMRFFKLKMNTFDLCIIVVAWIVSLYEIGSIFSLDDDFSHLVRSFSFLRIVFILRHVTVLQFLTDALKVALPSMGYITALLGIVLVIFAKIGVELFSFVKLQSTLNFDANFQHFPLALFTLFRVSTGENWNFLMSDLGRGLQPNFACVDFEFTYDQFLIHGVNGCGSRWTSIIFFFSFQVFYTLAMLNLLIAVILKAFEFEVIGEHDSMFNRNDFENFEKVWATFDWDATGFIKAKDFENFLAKLGAPLSWEHPELVDPPQRLAFIKELNLNAYIQEETGNFHDTIFSSKDHEVASTREHVYYYFHDVIVGLARHVFEQVTPLEENNKLIQIARKALIRNFHAAMEAHCKRVALQNKKLDDHSKLKLKISVQLDIKSMLSQTAKKQEGTTDHLQL